jgi:5-enolpyruvylshikimate-3-phosphate synthase
VPIRYTLPVASAQVKSAILLAGLNTPIGRLDSEASPIKVAVIGWLATRPIKSLVEVPECLLEGEDVLATAAAMRAMGADIVRQDDGVWVIHGVSATAAR